MDQISVWKSEPFRKYFFIISLLCATETQKLHHSLNIREKEQDNFNLSLEISVYN